MKLEEQNKIVQERRERKKEEKNKLKQLSLEFIQEKQKFEEYYQNLGKISEEKHKFEE